MVRRVIGLVIVASTLISCGETAVEEVQGDAAPTGPTAATAQTGATAPTGTTDATGVESGGGEAPDACALISSEQIAGIIGSDPGAGTSAGGGPRAVCFYETGLITSVETADNYEATKATIEGMRSIEPVSGVGTEAFWDGAGQLIALGDGFFVAVTFTAGDEATLIEQGKRILATMLANL